MMKILTQFLSKSFSKLAHNSTITNTMVANVIQTAAMTQDFLENTSKKMGNKPNADTIFDRIRKCDVQTLKIAFLFVLGFFFIICVNSIMPLRMQLVHLRNSYSNLYWLQ